MASKTSSWLAFALSANKGTLRISKHAGIYQTSSSAPATNTEKKWSITISSDHLKQCSNPSKLNESLLKHINSFYVEERKDVKHVQLVMRVRQLISKVRDEESEGLIMVDALQRLGIDYHFEDEIKVILERHYMQFSNTNIHEHRSLYELSLCFRLLRKQGFHVSADVFKRFEGRNGKFEGKLKNDIRGLIGLYFSSQLSIQGESILDEAAEFSCNLLEEKIKDLDDDRARMVRNTLGNSCQKSLSMFNLKNSIKEFNGTILQELAELDFTIVQSLRHRELNQISRWDINTIEQLPHYMKKSFQALYDVTNEIAYKIYKQHGFNPIKSLQKSWATLCDAFMVEARWFASGFLPKADEYLKNGIVSSGVHVVLVHMFYLLGDGTTKESMNLIDNNHGIMTSVAKILRLWDDFGSAQDENQDGHDGSYIKCYMKEHEGCSIQLAREHVMDMISETWKQLNKECLSPNPFSEAFTKGSVNMARMVPLMYSYGDNSSLPLLEDHMKSTLYDSL